MKDMDGVRNSDIFVLLTNEDGIGMYVELGMAIMSKIHKGKPRRVYVIGNKLGRSMFFFHPSVRRRKTIEDVFLDLGL
ncbi:MAG: hypothetical protein AAB922_03405 [Patescibacteria group bacterium]